MLDSIHYPADIKQLDLKQLQSLADEIREFLIENIQKTGGHLAPNLGTVEMSIAMHYVFDTPKDSFVFDVGHQAYTHKILTGRKDKMDTLRQKDGLSGFTKRAESEHDAFGAGHSSTSISAALGIAIGNKINNNNHKSIAVIGDGALTGGMSFEALNHAGDSDADLLIILNDNDMSISKNVGAMSKYLTKLISGKIYSTMKNKSLGILEKMPNLREFAKRSEEHLKGMILPSTLFEELGLDYYGPIDGHDLPTLVKTLQNLKTQNKPRLLHIITKKGYGLDSAENDPCKFHGIAPVTDSVNSAIPLDSYSNVFGRWLINTAVNNKKLIAITPAMCTGSGMSEFEQKFPEQYFDVGIAEQHAITFAGGLATQGLKPVVAIYSTFLQRGYDQLIHDIALQNLNVIFAIDRAGLVGADGATHAGSFDLSFLRCIPNLTIMVPSDGLEMYQMLNTALTMTGPVCVRYPRGTANIERYETQEVIEIGRAKVLLKGRKTAIFAYGNFVETALTAGKELGATVIDMRFVKPLDTTLISEMANSHQQLISIEDNAIAGGAGGAIGEYLQQQKITTTLQILGLPDDFTEQGSQIELYQKYGLTAQDIIKAASS
ncbi:1-deoxy-D-xylulose-5-phosphate synthase [Bathymodiolus septemdierum thioautotrophic gill symbiont]|uniref:1-deoxy-D-xylulose-5-phosphate synthase n=1 Tax=endosymbiont of Bathymodiolus septemdierum str. Myojin knoll TaxID=1303921 RepID=A0A0P0USZ0_9GAMM|nr:1-deoxy-D-xylulose-5-phosphate synthase [Bathymodiolus septemdierum thioautotrophic gill symbiont]BAS67989.1 1-deoxy-D-xylulose-5-phosphate synthase [endosymbiont of Bathymodiolus septemdierum str. Myojin knoll]